MRTNVMNTNYSLTLKNIKKCYVQKKGVIRKNKTVIQALDDICLEFKPGLYGLLGPNGAGKSTMIKIITANLKPDTGTVRWNEKSIIRLGIKYRRILGYMPQQQNLYSSYTGMRFLSYICTLKEIPKHRIEEEIISVSTDVNLVDQLDKKLSQYSGGMKQRILAASAFIGNPRLLILDEPTAGLDPKERVRMRELIKNLSENAIVIVATHVVSDVETVADKIILLNKGNVIGCDSPRKLIESISNCQSLEDVYLHYFGEDD